jgi:hypothetical protein
MKGLLRGRRFPLAQIKNRLGEISNFPDIYPDSYFTNKGTLQNLSPSSKRDRYCMVSKNVVIRVHSIDGSYVREQQFTVAVDEHCQPLNLFQINECQLKSSSMDMLVLSALEREMKQWPTHIFKNALKCIVVNYQPDENEPGQYLSMPLIHYKPRRVGIF